MRLTFSEPELAWLNNKMVNLAAAGMKTGNTKLTKLAAGMRYKFTPNASVVFLNRNERAAVFALVEAHVVDGQVPANAALLKSIAEKVSADANEGSNQG